MRGRAQATGPPRLREELRSAVDEARAGGRVLFCQPNAVREGLSEGYPCGSSEQHSRVKGAGRTRDQGMIVVQDSGSGCGLATATCQVPVALGSDDLTRLQSRFSHPLGARGPRGTCSQSRVCVAAHFSHTDHVSVLSTGEAETNISENVYFCSFNTHSSFF